MNTLARHIPVLALLALAGAAGAQTAAQVFSYPHDGTGTLIPSSSVMPDGSDADMFAYESFILAADADISEVRWRGGYIYDAMYGKVFDFSIYFYESIPGGSEPHVGNPDFGEIYYLAKYFVGDSAGETPAGTYGGKKMYDYAYALPQPFHAQAGVKYWIRMEGYQPTYPDWGIARGTGGNGSHFRFSTGMAKFYFAPGDTCFALLAPTCYADCDGSGALDIDDFICFQTLFGMADPGADCDQSGGLDIDDFICFQTAFGIGCG